MMGWFELAGFGIVAGALAQVSFALTGTVQRRVRQARLEREDARLFERRATLLLQAAEAERDKQQLSWTGPRKFTIAERVIEADDICSFYLKPHDQKPLPPFEPGQFLTFQLRIPGQPKPVIRCYSLSDSPLDRERYRVTIKRLPPPPDQPGSAPGLSSSFFVDTLREGDTVDVRAPSGNFILDRSHDRPVVLVAGGIGLTPLLSMLNTICESGDGRETWFFYGVHHGGQHAMKAHLARLAREHPNLHLVTCYSAPRGEDREGEDYQYPGHLSVELMRRLLPSANYDFYVCGRPEMMRAITDGLKAWGVPEDAVRVEAFGPASIQKVPRRLEAQEPAGEATTQAVEVEFARSGKQVSWTATAGALLELAEAQGIIVDFGCRAGSCNTCLTAIKSGEVDYLSEPSTPPEAGSCLICIAVPKGRLVLDA